MIGNFNLPLDKSSAKTFVFTAGNNTSQGTVWSGLQRWEKPKGINFIYGMIISAASGGGGGGTLGGGGGGTPGTYYTFLQPAFLVPDYLYISVGRGGAGGVAGTNGGFPNAVTGLLYDAASISSGVSLTRLQYVYLPIGSGTQRGGAGTSGAAGAGGTSISYTINQIGTYGFSNSNIVTPSSTGFNGGLTTQGADAPFLGRPQGGAGGGGRSGGAKAGGTVIQVSGGPFSNISKRFGGDPNGSKGDDGITLFEPTLFFTPGAGGGANDAGTGGKGGDGGIGCGGGGGGAGSTVGGAGGNGGDGLIILTCW